MFSPQQFPPSSRLVRPTVAAAPSPRLVHRAVKLITDLIPDFTKIMGFGDYPAEYNPNVHGPYDPARYYGKPDTPFNQLKLSELGSWFGRRKKSPAAVAGAFSRAWWRWQHKYVQPKKAGVAPFFQVLSGCMIFFYVINYGKLTQHRNYKYH